MKNKIRSISRIQYANSRYSIIGYVGSSSVPSGMPTTPIIDNILTEDGNFITTELGDLIKT